MPCTLGDGRRGPDCAEARGARIRYKIESDRNTKRERKHHRDTQSRGSIAELDVAQLRLIAEQGDAEAQTELGERYEDGRGGVGQDYGVAVSWFSAGG